MYKANITAALSAIAFVTLTAPAFADRSVDLADSDEVKSCVSAVTNQLDTSNADRIRHVVTDFEQEFIGYGVTIETAVFTGGEQANYSAYCIANKHFEPLRLRVREIEG